LPPARADLPNKQRRTPGIKTRLSVAGHAKDEYLGQYLSGELTNRSEKRIVFDDELIQCLAFIMECIQYRLNLSDIVIKLVKI
jgi:hypothetical protein